MTMMPRGWHIPAGSEVPVHCGAKAEVLYLDTTKQLPIGWRCAVCGEEWETKSVVVI